MAAICAIGLRMRYAVWPICCASSGVITGDATARIVTPCRAAKPSYAALSTQVISKVTSWPASCNPSASAMKGRMSPWLPHVCIPIFIGPQFSSSAKFSSTPLPAGSLKKIWRCPVSGTWLVR